MHWSKNWWKYRKDVWLIIHECSQSIRVLFYYLRLDLILHHFVYFQLLVTIFWQSECCIEVSTCEFSIFTSPCNCLLYFFPEARIIMEWRHSNREWTKDTFIEWVELCTHQDRVNIEELVNISGTFWSRHVYHRPFVFLHRPHLLRSQLIQPTSQPMVRDRLTSPGSQIRIKT